MTPSKQEIYHPTSSSSSSSSPTTTGSSDSETSAREDLCWTDSYPVSVSSEHVERKERGDPLTKPTKNPKPNKSDDHEIERGDPLCSEILEWHWRSRTSCRNFWWLDNSRSQGSQWRLWISNQSPICSRGARTWPPNGSSRIRAKQQLLRKHKGACKSSWSRIGRLKSFELTIPGNLARPVKIFPGIIVRQHHKDRKLMGLRKKQCAE